MDLGSHSWLGAIPCLIVCGALSACGDVSTAGAVPTLQLLAGSVGSDGSVDATGAVARFRSPYGVATDNDGNIYVADSGNNTIRKIDSAGAVTTLAGTAGVTGSADGTGPAASFNAPWGLATDSAGNVYVADSNNNTIRKVTPAGVVTTLAGTAGVSGSADGIGASASFLWPVGVATDAADNVYVAVNDTIRKITPAGVVTTLAGTAGVTGSADGVGAAARFWDPIGIATDSAGNLYVADYSTAIIRKVTAGGVVTTLAGTAGVAGSADGIGAAARFYGPTSLATDNAGNLYVADWYDNAIRKVTSSGVVTHLAGGSVLESGSTDGSAAMARFSGPMGVATDSAGNVYVADEFNNEVRKVTPEGEVTTVAGTASVVGNADGTGAAASFAAPEGVAADRTGTLYVADTGNRSIRRVTPTGVVSTLAAGLESEPAGLATDSGGNIYVAGAPSNTIWKITPAGTRTTLAGSTNFCHGCPSPLGGSADGTGAAAGFFWPTGVAIDLTDNIYVADSGNNTIRKISLGGVVTTLAGTAGVTGSADGTGPAASFNAPWGLATDSAGNVYVADSANNTIRKVTPAGVVTTLAGTAGVSGSADGIGASASFLQPHGVATDAAGNVYVADSGNHTIRKLTPAGVVTTLVGQPGEASFSPGPLPGLLTNPVGVASFHTTLYITTVNAIVAVSNVPESQ
ncbi:MAG TPA: NHL repeat-containing protein [Steroidobacteraceae bacterium]|nr:NHL repeat-containing protein [Steroidobacteraceae bacterium]